MLVTLKQTSKIVTLRIGGADVPARIWQGVTSKGIPCHAYITRIAVANDQDAQQFESELIEQEPPTAEIEAIPLRLIL